MIEIQVKVLLRHRDGPLLCSPNPLCPELDGCTRFGCAREVNDASIHSPCLFDDGARFSRL